MTLREALELVKDCWPFDEKNYPDLRALHDHFDRRNFMLQHILLHQQKTLGRLAELFEGLEHYRDQKTVAMVQNRTETFHRAARNFLINALRFNEVMNLKPEEIEEALRHWAKKKHEP